MVRINKRLFAPLFLFLWLACPAWGAPFRGVLAGTVQTAHDHTALAGVEVSIQVKGRYRKHVARANSAGSFTIRLADVFPGLSWEGSSLTLEFEKENFDRAVRVFSNDSAAPDFENLHIELQQLSGAAVSGTEETGRLAEYYSSAGSTLFLFPYRFSGGESGLDLEIFAENLYDRISDGLRPWLQALPGFDFDVSVQPLAEMEVASTNRERMYSLGKQLNALAVVSGGGQIEDGDGGAASVFLRSRYVAIPSTRGLRPGQLKIDDHFPIGLLNSMRLSERLNRYWEMQSALAICVREFERAQAEGSRDALQKVADMVVAARAEIGPDGPMQAEQFTLLYNLVHEEMRK